VSFEGEGSDTSVRLRDHNRPAGKGTGTFDLTGWAPERVVFRLKSGDSHWGLKNTAYVGDYFIALYNTWGGSISTSLTGMEVGAEYTVTWFERTRPGTGTRWQARGLTVLTDGCSGKGIMASHEVPDDWEQKSTVFKATSDATDLCFTTPGGDEDGAVFLDGIEVHPTKDPTLDPTANPTMEPTMPEAPRLPEVPSKAPTEAPTKEPTIKPYIHFFHTWRPSGIIVCISTNMFTAKQVQDSPIYVDYNPPDAAQWLNGPCKCQQRRPRCRPSDPEYAKSFHVLDSI